MSLFNDIGFDQLCKNQVPGNINCIDPQIIHSTIPVEAIANDNVGTEKIGSSNNGGIRHEALKWLLLILAGAATVALLLKNSKSKFEQTKNGLDKL